MELQSRRKRPTTAPPAGRASSRRGIGAESFQPDSPTWQRGFLWPYAIGAMLLGVPSALHAAKLNWKPVRPITQVQLEQSAKPRTVLDAYPVKPTAAQLSEDTGPLSDPFEDGKRAIESNLDEALGGLKLDEETPKPVPNKVETHRQPADRALDTVEDHFPDLHTPGENKTERLLLPELEAPPSSTEPSHSDLLRDSPYYEAPRPAEQPDCSDAMLDCNDALTRMKANTLANIDLDIRVGGREGQDFPCECPFGVDEVFQQRQFSSITYNWKASSLSHKPLYFEQVTVERYGHSAPTFVQAVLCGAHFFASVPALPYMMGLCPPDECQYSLGYYRPGSCAPYLIDPIPLSLRAGLFQAGAIVGGILIIP